MFWLNIQQYNLMPTWKQIFASFIETHLQLLQINALTLVFLRDQY